MDWKMLPFLFYLALLLCFNARTEAALAAMSIDLGSQYIKIGVVKPGVPMEIVLNKESRRKTPFVVAIRNGERFFSDAAAAMSIRYPPNAFVSFLDLIGKEISNPIVQKYQADYPHMKLIGDEKRGTVVFDSVEGKYSVETLLAMILWNAKEQTEAYAGQTIRHAIITIPAYFTQAERIGIANAAEIAGLKLLQILTEGSAAALNYGVFRRKEIKEDAQTLLIYDVGAKKTIATLVEYRLVNEKGIKEQNPVVTTLGVGFDRSLGGSDITRKLQKHLIEQFNAKTTTEKSILENPRAMATLFKEAERVKQVLSANTEHFAQIESLFEDKDFRVKVTRVEFENMFKDLELKFLQPISDALRMAEFTVDRVDQIVMLGAGTRVPRIQQLLQDFFKGKELGRFLNTDESIALGAVYQAAHLSKGFKVKKFDVQELQLYPIQVLFESGDSIAENKEKRNVSRTIYGYKSLYPAAKKLISFTSHNDDFKFYLNYGDLTHFNDEHLRCIDSLNISEIAVQDIGSSLKAEMDKDPEATFKGVKVQFHLNSDGIIKTEKAELIVELIEKIKNSTLSNIVGKIGEFFSDSTKSQEEDVVESDNNKNGEEKADEIKDSENSETPSKFDETNSNKEMEMKEENNTAENDSISSSTTTKTTTTTTTPTSNKKEDKKTKFIKIPLKLFVANKLPDLTEADIKENAKILENFATKERKKAEREISFNLLEAAIYDLSAKLNEEEFIKFGSAEEIEGLRTFVSTLRNWVEDDVGLDTTTEEFKTKKSELDKLVKKIHYRRRQKEARTKYIEEFEKILTQSNNVDIFKSISPEITDVDFTPLNKMIAEIQEWYNVKKDEQNKLLDHHDPAFTVAELKERASQIDREVKFLMNKLYSAKIKAEKEKLQKERDEKLAKAKAAAAAENEDKKKDGKKGDKEAIDEAKMDEIIQPIVDENQLPTVKEAAADADTADEELPSTEMNEEILANKEEKAKENVEL